MLLHAQQSDWKLRADGGTPRGDSVDFTFEYFLTDPQGNFLTDPQGNFLVGRQTDHSVSPLLLHALPSDWNLNA